MIIKIQVIRGGPALELELDSDATVSEVCLLIECETDIASSGMSLYHQDGRLKALTVAPESTLGSCGIDDGHRIYAAPPGVQFTVADVLPENATAFQPQLLWQRLVGNPYDLGILQQQNPELADAVKAGDFSRFRDIFSRQDTARREAEAERVRRAAALQANPFDLEAQRFIEQQIRLENVESLRQEAIEHMPESFGVVVMLYIDVVVNGHAIKAFVDSGAQMTIMSKACAERTGVARHIDTRFQGTAVGVGTQKILGRIHMYQLDIAGASVPTSFTILEEQPMDMLLGLDMLRRHQCCIDLAQNRLVIGTTGTSTPFLAEKDLPESARLSSGGIGGASGIGASSGASGDGRQRQPGAAPSSSSSNSSTTAATGSDKDAAATTEAKFSDATVAQLLGLGDFTRAQVIEALTVCNGNTEQAAAYLFAQHSK
eukprot:UC1_evm1s99